MWLRWLTVFSYFSLQESIILFAGKLGLTKSDLYNKLDDRKNKLDILYLFKKESMQPVDSKMVLIKFVRNNIALQCELRIEGSDVLVFHQIFVKEEFSFVIDLFLKNFETLPTTCIDAGSNIGMVGLYLKSINRTIKLITIEPDTHNNNRMRRNFEINGFSCEVENEAALWPTQTNLEVVNDFRDQMDWSLRVKENRNGKTRAITPTDAVNYFEANIDLFKIDIEGGESELFDTQSDLSWLSSVKMITIEIHEEKTSRSKIEELLKLNGFTIYTHGELTIGVNTLLRKIIS